MGGWTILDSSNLQSEWQRNTHLHTTPSDVPTLFEIQNNRIIICAHFVRFYF